MCDQLCVSSALTVSNDEENLASSHRFSSLYACDLVTCWFLSVWSREPQMDQNVLHSYVSLCAVFLETTWVNPVTSGKTGVDGKNCWAKNAMLLAVRKLVCTLNTVDLHQGFQLHIQNQFTSYGR